MAQDGQNSKKPLVFVGHKDDLEAHQAFLRDLVGQGKEAWNLWRNENLEPELNFSSMEFPDETSFQGFEFGDDVDFNKATFGDNAAFSKATFGNSVYFREATFGNSVYFRKATFGDNADFSKATFGSSVYFREATFGDNADFSKATFGNSVYFREATFGNSVYFRKATFGDNADFSKATFGNRVYFREATFGNSVYFEEAMFGNSVYFEEATFGNIVYFREATFGTSVFFTACTFGLQSNFDLLFIKGYIDFAYSFFFGVPSFFITSEDDKLKINIMDISIGKTFGETSDVRNLQLLKGIADSTNAVNEARDIFILQRQAERENAWREWRETIFDFKKKTTAFPLPQSIMAGLFWILADYGRSVLRPIAWLLLSIPLFYYLYRWLYPANLKMVAQRDALIDYTLSSSIPFGRVLNPGFDRAFEWLFPKTHHQIIGTVDITIGFQIASIAQGIVSFILLFLIGLSIRNYFKIS